MKESAGADCTINSGCNCTCWVGHMWRRPLPNLFCVFRWIIHSPPNPFFIWGIIQRAIAKWRIFTEIDFFLSLLFLHFHTNIRTFQCCCIKGSTSRMDTVYFTPRLNTLKTQKSPTAATTSLRKSTVGSDNCDTQDRIRVPNSEMYCKRLHVHCKPLPEHLLTPNRCRQKFVFHPLMVEFTRFIHYLCVIRLISIPVSVVHRRFGQNPVRLDGIRIVRDQSKHATFFWRPS